MRQKKCSDTSAYFVNSSTGKTLSRIEDFPKKPYNANFKAFLNRQ
jgi:hypothetical protein